MHRCIGLTAATVLLLGASVASATDRVYWGGYGGGAKVAFANLDGTGGADLSTTPRPNDETFGLGIDAAAGRIYWAEDSGNRISYADLDGSGGNDLNTTGATVNNPEGFAIDPAAGKVYWSNNGGGGAISFARLDGSGGGDLNTSGATPSVSEGVAIDPPANRIYWANNSANKISYAKLDGSGGGTDLNTGGATINRPIGLALDTAGGRVYWANDIGGRISYANLDGSGGGDLSTAGATTGTSAIGVAIDRGAGRIYWGNYAANKISFANLDGSGGGGDVNLTGADVNGPAMPVLLRAPATAGPPAITGATTPGSVLSCSQGSWEPDILGAFLFHVPQSFSYQWSLNGADIVGATASSYTTFASGEYRCKATASNAAGATAQTSAPQTIASPPPPPPTLATISSLRATNTTFAVARASTPLTGTAAAKRHKRGTVFSFRLDQAATVKIVIKTKAGGRLTRGTLNRVARSGLNKVAFSGRIGKKALRAGRYTAAFTAVDSAGASPTKTLSFRVVAR
jgi:hypothetical protein